MAEHALDPKLTRDWFKARLRDRLETVFAHGKIPLTTEGQNAVLDEVHEQFEEGVELGVLPVDSCLVRGV